MSSIPRNRVLHQSGYVPGAQAACPIVLGETGIWTDGSVSPHLLMVRAVDGSDTVLAALTEGGVPMFAAVTKTTAPLASCIYDNGADDDGVGATLTAAAVGAIGTVGGVALGSAQVGKAVLVDSQVDGTQNGLYVLTDQGKANPSGRQWVLTRLPGFDSVIVDGALVVVQQGTYADQIWEQTASVGTVGTDPVAFQVSASAVTLAAVASALGISAATAITATNVGAGAAGKILKLDADGKLAGRVLETDGSKLDGIDAGAKALDSTAGDIAPLGPAKVAGATGKAADAGHVHQADKAAFRVAYFAGVDASGGASHVVIVALKVGDQVLDIFNITDGADGAASFEATVTVNGQLQQPATNLTTKNFKAIFVAKS